MFKQHVGMVLFSTLLMMVILTILVLAVSDSVLMYAEVNLAIRKKHTQLQRIEEIAKQITMKEPDANCRRRENDVNQVITRLRQGGGCITSNDGQKYNYLVNDLGVEPCLHVRVAKKNVSSHLWLVTVASAATQQIILQLRFVKPHDQLLSCPFLETRRISDGIISWRYLYN